MLLKPQPDSIWRIVLPFRQWRSQNEAEEAMPLPSPRNKPAKFFTGALYQFSTVRKTSVTDNCSDWPLPNKILGCSTAFRAWLFLTLLCPLAQFATAMAVRLVFCFSSCIIRQSCHSDPLRLFPGWWRFRLLCV